MNMMAGDVLQNKKKSINDLDDLSLLGVFNRLPVRHLLIAGHVSSRWNFIRSKSASTRTSLDLLIGPYIDVHTFSEPLYWIKQVPYWNFLIGDDGKTKMFASDRRKNINFDLLYVSVNSLPLEYAQFIFNTLPAISDLNIQIQFEPSKSIDPLIYLLERWSTKLTKLTVDILTNKYTLFQLAQGKHTQPPVYLLYCINSLPKLRHLHFSTKIRYKSPIDETPQINLPIIARLESFSFRCCDYEASQLETLIQFGQSNDRLSSVCILSLIAYTEPLLRIAPQFAQRFSFLWFCIGQHNINQYPVLCAKFANLTSLSIWLDIPTHTRHDMFKPLLSLTRLISLKLQLSPAILEQLSPEEDAQICDPKLLSVKVLSISVCTSTDLSIETHSILTNFRFDSLMPNLQVILINIIKEISETDTNPHPVPCDECKTKSGKPEALDPMDQSKHECVREIVKSLKECQQMRLLVTLFPQEEWWTDELKLENDDE